MPASPSSTQPAPAPTPAPTPAPPPPAPSAPPAAPPPTDAPPPKFSGPASKRMFGDLEEFTRKQAAPGTEEPSPNEPPPEETPKPAEQQDDQPPEDTDAKAGKGKEGKKRVNAWKKVDEYKKQVSELERKLAEKGGQPDERVRTQLEALYKRNQQLENAIRFADYSQSREFKEKYQQPYEAAWQKAMSELGELTVSDDSGHSRAVNANDLLQLVNLPLSKARELAQERFGNFADDVMQHRKEIRRQFDAQSEALTKARESASQMAKHREHQMAQQMQSVQQTIKETFTKASEELMNDPKFGQYFKPMEGDEEHNRRLTRGFEIADKALRSNPMNPKLTQEQREEAVRALAAVRGRAAAFGPTLYRLQKAEARAAALEKELGEYKNTTPKPTGGRAAPASAKKFAKTSDELLADLDRLVGKQ